MLSVVLAAYVLLMVGVVIATVVVYGWMPVDQAALTYFHGRRYARSLTGRPGR